MTFTADGYHEDTAMLCGNCLHRGAARIEVGRERGPQRDTSRALVPLCEPCRTALVGGDFATLNGRFAAERTVGS